MHQECTNFIAKGVNPMAVLRNGSPFYRKATGKWYAWVDGKQTALGVCGKQGGKQALLAWRQLLSASPPPALPISSQPQLQLASLIDAFLSDATTRLKPSTCIRYHGDLETLQNGFSNTSITSITHQLLTLWLAKSSGNPTTKCIRIRSVSAFFGWCVKQDFLMVNPAIKVAKPKSRSRTAEAVISEVDHQRLLSVATPCFRVVLQILYATGCRPSEACAITSDNFDPANGVVVLEVHKSDHNGKPRLIFLPPEVVELLQTQVAKYGHGKLLRSRQGHPLTSRAITFAMMRLRRQLGISAIAYGYRHAFATRALSKGIPDAHVAALLGHSSTATLHKFYSHLTSQSEVLRQALSQM